MQTCHQNVYRDTTTWWGHTTWDMSTLYPLPFFLSLSGGRLGFRPWWRLRVSSGCKESSCSSLATASLCGLGAADRDTSTGSSSFSPAPPPSSPFPAMTEGGRHTTPEKSTLAFVMATCKTKQKNIDHKSHMRVLAIRPVQCGVFHAINMLSLCDHQLKSNESLNLAQLSSLKTCIDLQQHHHRNYWWNYRSL